MIWVKTERNLSHFASQSQSFHTAISVILHGNLSQITLQTDRGYISPEQIFARNSSFCLSLTGGNNTWRHLSSYDTVALHDSVKQATCRGVVSLLATQPKGPDDTIHG